MAAQLEVQVPCGFDDSNRKLQQLKSDGVDPILSHGVRQNQAPEPVEEIVRQCVNLNPVGVDDHGRAADIKIFVAFQRSTCYNSQGTSLLWFIVLWYLHYTKFEVPFPYLSGFIFWVKAHFFVFSVFSRCSAPYRH